jgi:rhodanese-related sulfurtransferase
MIRILSIFSILSLWAMAISSNNLENLEVKINKDIPYIETKEGDKKVIIKRIQDPSYKLTDDFTKTSRPCPPFCIQPTKLKEGIKNIAELELLEFIRTEVKNDTGVLIDTRLVNWYTVESIPSAINLPFKTVQKANKEIMQKIFEVFGMRVLEDKTWDFSKAKKLVLFCNGVWCEQSKKFIDAFLKYDYPLDRIYYYRSGFQGWKLLGLTTVIHEGNIK